MNKRPLQKGSVALLASFILSAMVLFVGVAIDYNRLSNARTNAEQIAESVALRVVRERLMGDNRRTANDDGQSEFNSQKSKIPFNKDATVTIIPSPQGVAAKATAQIVGTIETSFLKIAGIKSLGFEATAEAVLSADDFEVVLVLDVSQSMGNALQNLKDAAEDFVKILFEADLTTTVDRRITIIPFADSVNFGAGATNYLHPDTSISEPSNFVGCFRPFTPADIVSNTPLEMPGEFRAYVNSSARHTGNPLCPPVTSTTLMFSENQSEITNKVRGLDFGFGTGSDIAVSWGWRALSPSWRGRFNESTVYPKNYNANQRKILVFLTDGKPIRANPTGGHTRNSSEAENDKALENLDSLCNAIEVEDQIDLYSIGFKLNTTDPENLRVLTSCTAGTGEYFSSNRQELNGVFRTIAQQIINVRVTR